LEAAADFANKFAPEHLEVQIDTRIEKDFSKKLNNYGSLFVGSYAPVTLGDFVSGTNHILPTMSTARYSSGVWVGTFIKTAFHQYVTREGLASLSKPCITMAETEGLYAHKNSIQMRQEQT
jgi:histidinol dehydrogenase/sulfopropanediol 3-dehydrogenase